MKRIKVIGFDADDTLWENEIYFRESEKKFFELLKEFAPAKEIEKKLYNIETINIPLFGYGVKSFTLSMIETALQISKNKVKADVINQIMEIGREQLEKPVVLLPFVRGVLERLSGNYKLVVVTKGDLLDQELKLQQSGLKPFFHHVEIVSHKTETEYTKVIKHLDIRPNQFMMVGNSIKSDILPVLRSGAKAVYIPHESVWIHEIADAPVGNPKFRQIHSILDLLRFA